MSFKAWLNTHHPGYRLEWNFILRTDSYKLTQPQQYPEDSERIITYMESRGGQFRHTKFFGMQYYTENYLQGQVVTRKDVDIAEKFAEYHFGRKDAFDRSRWDYIVDHHEGYLPIEIASVDEGAVVPVGNVLMTMRATDPKCFWLTTPLETLLMKLWYPTTVATLSYECRNIIQSYMEKTCDREEIEGLLPFMLHDFGDRGSTSEESAAIGGAAHLTNFMGSDTLQGISFLIDHYGADMAGFSVAAMEHSTVTSWGRENEVEAYRNMLKQFPNGIVSIVADSYDIFNACEQLFGVELHEEIISRDGVLVVRPDSGEPKLIVAEILNILGRKFGYTTNSKGYKVLNPKVRVLQGDGISIHSIPEILDHITKQGWATSNMRFGMGGKLLQGCDRDTQRFAIKASSIVRSGQSFNVVKDPITDAGKRSKGGDLRLYSRETPEGVVYRTVQANEPLADGEVNALYVRFCDGWTLNSTDLYEVRSHTPIRLAA